MRLKEKAAKKRETKIIIKISQIDREKQKKKGMNIIFIPVEIIWRPLPLRAGNKRKKIK